MKNFFLPAKKSMGAMALMALALLSSGPSMAGRPLSVDDANVNDPGAGHVEAWYARQADNTNVWTLAPAYGLADGIEIGLAVARDASNDLSTNLLQGKFRLSPAKSKGCNMGSSFGASQANNGLDATPFVNGLLSCNLSNSAMHLNLGATRPPSGPTLGTWGLALEHAFATLIAHTEYFGQEQGNPTLQLGVRTEVLKNIQLDGTLGRFKEETLLSLGLKFQF